MRIWMPLPSSRAVNSRRVNCEPVAVQTTRACRSASSTGSTQKATAIVIEGCQVRTLRLNQATTAARRRLHVERQSSGLETGNGAEDAGRPFKKQAASLHDRARWTSNCWSRSASILSPFTSASNTFTSNAGLWLCRGSIVMVSPVAAIRPPSGRNSTYPNCPELPRQLSSERVACRCAASLSMVRRPPASPSTKNMLKPLTSLRFIAAFAVLAQHSGMGTLGGTAVSFFFVLSGFIITYGYADRLKIWDSSESHRFLILRAARLFPIHIVTMFGAIVISGFNGEGIFSTAANALLIQSFLFSGPEIFSFNGASWSISDEMFFYLFTPLLMVIFYRFGLYKRHKAIALWVFALIVLTAICWMVGSNIAPFSTNWWLVYIFPPIRLLDYIAGMALALVFRLSGDQHRIDLGRVGGTLLELGAIAVFVLTVKNISMVPFAAMGISAGYIPAFCLIIYAFARSEGLISKLLSYRIFVYLGEISFSFYMIHTLVIISLGKFFGPTLWSTEINSSKLYAFGFAAITTLAFSDALYRYIEIPSRRRAEAWLKREYFIGALTRT